MRITVDRVEAELKRLERPSLIGPALKKVGDADIEWWGKGWDAAVKRMREAFDGAPCVNCGWSQVECEKRKCCTDCHHSARETGEKHG